MLHWLLKYPAEDFARGRLIFAGGWSPVLLWGALLLGAVLIVAVGWRRARALGALRATLIYGLQIAMLGLVLLAIAQPSLLLRSLRAGDNSIAVLLDNSASMRFVDGSGTRTEQARAVLNSQPLRELMNRYRIQRYYFADSARETDGYDAPPDAGDQTAIAGSLLQVLRQLHTSALGAVVLISDGADSAGPLSADALAEIASYGVPVHTIGIGREQMPEDLELQDVRLPSQVLPQTSISARVAIRHDGGGSTRVKVFDGDRFLGAQDVLLAADAPVTTAAINVTLSDTGTRDLRFTLEPKAGERELRNNTRERIVDVSARRASILYVEGEPRWEYKFMRRALESDSSVRLVSLLRTSNNGYYRQGTLSADELKGGFPSDRRTLFAYDALIIGSMPAAWFNSQQLQLIHDFVSERGGSVLMLAGPNGLGDGGWGHTVVGDLLPSQLPSAGNSFHRVRVQALPTARARRSPVLQLADDPAQNDRLWRELPPLEDYQDLGPSRLAATTLLELQLGSRTQPLLVSQPYGRGRGLILATGGTWRWRMGLPNDDTRHQQFWRQLARSLVGDVPQPIELRAQLAGDQAVVRAEVRDPTFAAMTGALVSVTASSAQATDQFQLQPVADQPGVYEAHYQPAHSGSYVIEASVSRDGKALGSARTSLRFERGEAEYFSLRQNRALLERLATSTGGRYWRPDQLAGLPAAVRASSAGVAQQEILPLWDAPALFALLALLKCAEWLLRRRWGAV